MCVYLSVSRHLVPRSLARTSGYSPLWAFAIDDGGHTVRLHVDLCMILIPCFFSLASGSSPLWVFAINDGGHTVLLPLAFLLI
jgi:hypothetical protein